MNGLVFIPPLDPLTVGNKEALQLLVHRNELEIMCQAIGADNAIWLIPAADPEAIEFFLLLEGELICYQSDGTRRILSAGAGFYTQNLDKEVNFLARTPCKLLCVTNRPVYDSQHTFQDKLRELISQINEKDHITQKHSRNVVRYSLALYSALRPPEPSMDDMAVAAMFHDVGKCETPDAILKKSGRLTDEEFAIIRRHPVDSYQILMSFFGEKVAAIARGHHERLDGSGYPDRLKGDEIPLGAQIIAVADSFDAMTSVRTYNTIRTFSGALDELYACAGKYNTAIVDALAALYRSGELDAIRTDNDEADDAGLSKAP